MPVVSRLFLYRTLFGTFSILFSVLILCFPLVLAIPEHMTVVGKMKTSYVGCICSSHFLHYCRECHAIYVTQVETICEIPLLVSVLSSLLI